MSSRKASRTRTTNVEQEQQYDIAIHWFRNGLRFHDNPCFLDATRQSKTLIPLFVLDLEAPLAQTHQRSAGIIRTNFVLESLRELDGKLRKQDNKQTQLCVVLGKPAEILPQIVAAVGAQAVFFENEVAAPVREMDGQVRAAIRDATSSCKIHGYDTHTLHPMEHYLRKCGESQTAPSTYGGFTKIFQSLRVPAEVDDVTQLPPLPDGCIEKLESIYAREEDSESRWGIPSLERLGFDNVEDGLAKRKKGGIDFIGGEDEALKLLDFMMQRTRWVATFEKPKTSPNALSVDTTGLSPYVKHGCLSPRRFYHELSKVYAKVNERERSKPPVSLHGQLMWREYNYLMGYTTPNFDKMVDNPVARQIPWDDDPQLVEKWRNSQTGYPFLDAIMTQLRETGWIHHLARHAVACFLTRGDLWQSWEKGAEVFEELLIDADWSINNFNWQWLSCTAHFYQYFRCYSPVAFGKKTDPNGDYIRKWLPQFKNFPKAFIYTPWEAPIAVQRRCGVVVGENYPHPLVEHKTISKANMGRMKDAYDAQRADEAAAETQRSRARPAESANSGRRTRQRR